MKCQINHVQKKSQVMCFKPFFSGSKTKLGCTHGVSASPLVQALRIKSPTQVHHQTETKLKVRAHAKKTPRYYMFWREHVKQICAVGAKGTSGAGKRGGWRPENAAVGAGKRGGWHRKTRRLAAAAARAASRSTSTRNDPSSPPLCFSERAENH